MCLNVYTDPKTLPCLHTFCCHCLNQLKEKRVNREPIKCPDCRTEINLPEGSNFDAIPSSFYLNRLKDILSVQQEGDNVLCGSCDNKSTVVAFCFNCECFICAECRDSHPRFKAMKGTRFKTQMFKRYSIDHNFAKKNSTPAQCWSISAKPANDVFVRSVPQ